MLRAALSASVGMIEAVTMTSLILPCTMRPVIQSRNGTPENLLPEKTALCLP